MWIFTKDSFLSIVHDDMNPFNLLVRARVMGDIQKAFEPDELRSRKPRKTAQADYLYRSSVPADIIASMMARQVTEIDYGNFKDAVTDPRRHGAYIEVWMAMQRLQDRLVLR